MHRRKNGRGLYMIRRDLDKVINEYQYFIKEGFWRLGDETSYLKNKLVERIRKNSISPFMCVDEREGEYFMSDEVGIDMCCEEDEEHAFSSLICKQADDIIVVCDRHKNRLISFDNEPYNELEYSLPLREKCERGILREKKIKKLEEEVQKKLEQERYEI